MGATSANGMCVNAVTVHDRAVHSIAFLGGCVCVLTMKRDVGRRNVGMRGRVGDVGEL